MHIFNAMFGRGLGGIEQSFLDYSQGLTQIGHKVTSLVQPGAQIIAALESRALPTIKIRNFGTWDVSAAYQLARAITVHKPDIIISHGGRAASLLQRAAKGKVPVVGVCHNYSIKRLLRCETLFTVTEDLRQYVIQAGKQPETVFAIPNMIAVSGVPTLLPKTWRSPPVIGTMGRFVKKKGFEYYVEALAILKSMGIEFQAILAGEGEAKKNLENLAKQKGVDDLLTFSGWAKDKTAFFNSIDIFCLPSSEETFGIVILEAFVHGVPVVSTLCKGPKEIVSPDKDGIMVARNDATALANGIERLLLDKNNADSLAVAGYHKVTSQYAMPAVIVRIDKIVQHIAAVDSKIP